MDEMNDLFKNVRFFVSGDVDEEIINQIKFHGGERMNYFTDYVTHLLCGKNPEENDITDAIDLYEIPAITIKWILQSLALKKLVDLKPYIYDLKKLFTNLTFTFSHINRNDRHILWSLITYNGGQVQLNLDKQCTHLITINHTSVKYLKAINLSTITIVTPDWLYECLRHHVITNPECFHPKLLLISDEPVRTAPSGRIHESTIAITGFEPESSILPTNTDTDNVSDSTQALLDKLKQRMRFNQPTTGVTTCGISGNTTITNTTIMSTTDMVPPPNVIAPTYRPTLRGLNQQQFQQTQNRMLTPGGAHTRLHLRPGQIVPQQIMQQRMVQQQQQRQQVRPFGLTQPNQQFVARQPQMAPQPQQSQQQMVAPQQIAQNLQQQIQQQNQQFGLMQQQQQQQVLAQQQKLYVQPQQQQMLQTQQFNQFNQSQQNFGMNSVEMQTQQQQQQQSAQQQFPQHNQQMALNPIPNQYQPRPPPPQQQLWQQQQQSAQQPSVVAQQQLNVRQQVNIIQGPRVQWSTQQQAVAQQQQQQQQQQLPQRQFIHLDAQTHNQLQKMPPEQQALFVARLQKQRQLFMQRQAQQRAVAAGGGHILIRGSVPPGLSPQQQMEWLQQQAKQQGVVLPPNIQQQMAQQQQQQQQPTQSPQTPGLSPIQQVQFNDQQLRQYRLQQLQLQREQLQKTQQLAQQQQQVVRAITPIAVQPTVVSQQQQQQPPPSVQPSQPQTIADSTTGSADQSHPLVVNAKTKTALANMLSIRLQSGTTNVVGQDVLAEPSAAGTLRLMTAQHNATLNSTGNRTQDLVNLQQQQQQQRRVITGPNGEIIRAPVPTTPTNLVPNVDGNKLQYPTAQSVVPTVTRVIGPSATPLQHRPGPFYGHNPNLKLPPDLFLLGCIFVVVEIESYLDEHLPKWRERIERHGGEIEKQYCARVTHVLCETQRHGVVMQAIRDYKRCVTIYWLSDVMLRKQVLPPWIALHLPTIYLDTTPATKHLICQTGFVGNDRLRVKHMINYTGAKYTNYYSKHNTLLIAAKPDGRKYIHSKKWGIPIVNVQWLTDIMLGNFTALNQMDHIIYQQFNTPPNFSFDPKLVPNLMNGWKMPINISQETYERVKRSGSPLINSKMHQKKFRNETDENGNIGNCNDDVNLMSTHRILFSRCTNLDEQKKYLRELGGILTQNHMDCTHLVMPSIVRTNKLLYCIARSGVRIVNELWLHDSYENGQFMDETNYFPDAKLFNDEFQCDLRQMLSTNENQRLFEGRYFWITPSVFPSRHLLIQLVQMCGGVVEKVRRSLAQIEATNTNAPYTYVIITHENDIHLVADLLKNRKDKKIRIICSAEMIFSAILRQKIEFEPYAVKVL